MPLPFNKTLDLKLISLVKENKILYNPKHPKYLHFDSREVIWQKIGDALNRPGPVCKSRWINIRDMMRRKHKERLKNPHSNRIYNYKYEEELAFMTPFFKESTGGEDFAEYLDDEADTEIEMPNEVFVNDNGDFDEDIKLHIRKQDASTNNTREFNTETVFQELNPADPLDVFLLTIGTTLRKFSPYYLNQAKSKIFQVVQDYELQQIVNKDDPCQTTSDGNR